MLIKKTLKASEQDREDVKKKREDWQNFQRNSDPARLVFLDETGAKTNMTRLYGRALGGRRCLDHAPDGRWERTTILSALWANGETCSMIFEGALDRRTFEAYMEKFLAPNLHPNDIVVMDNLNVHKSDRIEAIMAARGAKCVFLPEYSPDLNPIEKMWSKVKQILRGIKPRSRQQLDEAIGKALEMVSPADAKGWFESCGYV